MGMFDSLIDGNGNEWQTKAYYCILMDYRVGDDLPTPSHATATTYQVEVLGGPYSAADRDSYATVRDDVLVSIDDERDEGLPLIDYFGSSEVI